MQGCESIILCAVSKSLSTDPDFGRGEFFRLNRPWKKAMDYISKDGEVTEQVYKISEKLTGLHGKNDVERLTQNV